MQAKCANNYRPALSATSTLFWLGLLSSLGCRTLRSDDARLSAQNGNTAPPTGIYEDRKELTELKAVDSPDVLEGRTQFIEAQLNAAALIGSLYRDHEIYFLARDGEYLYDTAKKMMDKNGSIHLINVSRKLKDHANVLDYLSEFGLQKGGPTSGKPALFVDTGHAGTVPTHLINILGLKLGKNANIQLMRSKDTSTIPATYVFLSALSEQGLDDTSDRRVVEYEHLPHDTESASEYFQDSDGKWKARSIPALETELNFVEKYREHMAHVLDQPSTKKEFDLKLKFVGTVLETAKQNDSDALVNLFKNALKSSKSNAYSKFVYATAYDYASLRSLGVIKGPKLATRELRERAFLPIGIKKTDKISVVATAVDLFLKSREKDAADLLKLSKIKLDLQSTARNDHRLNILDHENLVLGQLVNSGVKVGKTLPTEIRNALARARIASADHANVKSPAELSLDYIVAMEIGLGGEIAQYAKKNTAILAGNADFSAAFMALHPADSGDLAAIKSLIPHFKNTPLGKNKLKALASTPNLSPSSAAKVTTLIVDFAPKLGATPSLQLAMIEALNSSQDSKRELAHEIMYDRVTSPEVAASLVKFIAQSQNPSNELQEVSGELVANTEPMQNELIKLLKLKNGAIADVVSDVFAESKKLKPGPLNELKGLLSLKDPIVELSVLKVISPMLKSDPATHPILLNLLANGANPKVKVAVLSNLKYIKLESPATQLAAIEAITSLNDPAAAIEMLGKFPKIELPSKVFQQSIFKMINADPATTIAALTILSEAKTLEPSSEILLLDAYAAGDNKTKTIILTIFEQLEAVSSDAVSRLTLISSKNDKAATRTLEVIVTNQLHKRMGDKNLSAKEKCSLLEATFMSLVQ